MDTLSQILSSCTRAGIFKLLFGTREEELHIRKFQRRSQLNDRTIRQELAKLLMLGLVIDRKDSNRAITGQINQILCIPIYITLFLKVSGSEMFC